MTAACRSFFLDAGPRGQRLCVHHAAQGVVTPRAQVLLLPPFAEELNKSRRMIALAARAFAQAGFEVLVMDLLGCGDSSGDFGDAGWQDWLDDVHLAADWLTAQAPRPDTPLWLWGVRAGALFAAPLAERLDRPVSLLLWQPVTAGKLQLQQFLRLKVAADLVGGQAKGAMQALRGQLDQGDAVEVAGYRLSPALARGLDEAQLKPSPLVQRLVWLETSTREDPALTPAAAMAVKAWTDQGGEVTAEAVPGPSFWAATEIEVAPALITSSVEALLRAANAMASGAGAGAGAAAAAATASARSGAADVAAEGVPRLGPHDGAASTARYRDTTLTVPCGDERLIGVLSEPLSTVESGPAGAPNSVARTPDATTRPFVTGPLMAAAPPSVESPTDLGVLLIVGGPQYRVGCHRQFTLLGRALAEGGIPCLRIDYRGMGDATGETRDFEEIDDDIAAAIDHWQRERPHLRRVLIWGLCDAASAALMYVHRRRDPRVAGLCLANPWVRTQESLARAQVKHYYWDRLRQASFWRKLLSGRVGLSAVKELLGKIGQARGASRAPGRGEADRAMHYTDRMAAGLHAFEAPVLLMLSGDDLVAKEFLDRCRTGGPAWAGLLARPLLRREDLPEADHTFASAAWRARVERWTLSFAASIAAGGDGRRDTTEADGRDGQDEQDGRDPPRTNGTNGTNSTGGTNGTNSTGGTNATDGTGATDTATTTRSATGAVA